MSQQFWQIYPTKPKYYCIVLERAAAGIGLHVSARKTEYMRFNLTGDISTLDGSFLKLVDNFPDLRRSVSSTEKDIDTWLTMAGTAIDKLSIIWKTDLKDKIESSGRIDSAIWMHYLDANKTVGEKARRQLHKNAASNIKQVLEAAPEKHQLYVHLPPITKTIQVRRSRDELRIDVLLWTPTYGRAKAGRPAWTQQLCENSGCTPEDLPEAMDDREKWWERVRVIRAGSMTWWWWWSYLNCMLMLNSIIWKGTVFDIETVLTLNCFFFIYRTALIFNCEWTNSVLMPN